MSWDGFLPAGTRCKRCAKVLEGQGEGHPAESYLGTYTGLCDRCTHAPAWRDESRQTVSGAWYWEHPPSCSSHRRDRKTYLAFADCVSCKGRGAVGRTGGCFTFNSYKVQCPKCKERHFASPIVGEVSRIRMLEGIKTPLVMDVANRVWKDQCRKEGIPVEDRPLVDGKADLLPRQTELAREIVERFRGAEKTGVAPIAWPQGIKPKAAEIRKVRKVYGYKIPVEELDIILPLPTRRRG